MPLLWLVPLIHRTIAPAHLLGRMRISAALGIEAVTSEMCHIPAKFGLIDLLLDRGV
jgi:hypothetical protein